MAEVNNVKLLSKEPRNKGVLTTIEEARQTVEANPDIYSVLVYLKSSTDVTRLSSGLDDLMELLGMLEMAKTDVIFQINNSSHKN